MQIVNMKQAKSNKQAKQKKIRKTRKSKPHTHLDAYIETQAKFNIPISRCDKESALKN